MLSQSIAHPKLRDSRAWAPTLLLALLLGASIVTFLDKWLWSNELFNSLTMGLSYEAGEQGLAQLREEALHYCDQFAAVDEVKACRIYQDSISDQLYFAHPLAALLGLQVRGLVGDPDWLQGLHWIAIQLPLLSGTAALIIWSLLTLALPRPERRLAVAVTLLLLLISHSHDRNYAPVPDALRGAGGWLPPATLALATLASFALARVLAVPWPRLAASTDPGRVLIGIAVALFLLSTALPPAFNAALAAVALVALFFGALPIVARATSFAPAVIAGVVGLLFVAVTAAPLWYLRRFGYASSFVSLVYMAVIALATARPGSRWVWLMPAMALFHLPIAALLGTATVIAEGLLILVHRRPSPLLVASLLTAAIGLWGVAFLFESTAFTPGSARPGDAISLIAGWRGLPAALATLALTFLFAIIPLRMPEGLGLPLARGGLLITGGLAIWMMAAALQDLDPDLLNAPGFALFAKSGDYATPALFLTGILVVFLALGQSLGPEGDTHRAPGRSTVMVLSSVLLLVAVAKTDLRLRYAFLPAPIDFWKFVVSGELHPAWCRHLTQARLTDETYYLSPSDPTNDSIIYWSALKARLRIEAGLLHQENMSFQPMIDDPQGCIGR